MMRRFATCAAAFCAAWLCAANPGAAQTEAAETLDETRFAAGLAAYDAGDYGSSLEAWQPLAGAGDVAAQVALAGLYMSGLGVARDPAEAVLWYRRAALAGDPVAQLNLGDLYGRGQGVPRDPLEAYAWFSLAADQGRRWAALRRDELAGQLTPGQLAEARELIARYRPAE